MNKFLGATSVGILVAGGVFWAVTGDATWVMVAVLLVIVLALTASYVK